MKLIKDILERITFVAFSIITTACVVYYILYVPVTLDDSFVYFRVVERFVATGIPTFNDGDTGNITTSPLWLIILSIAYIITGKVSLIILSKTCSIILMIGASWLLYRILERRLAIAAPFAGIAVFFSPLINTLLGQDTAIALTCGLGVINAFEADKKSLPIWVALSYLARGEGIIFGDIVAIIAFFRSSLKLKERIQYYFFPALIGAALILIWHGFYWSVFGDVFPSTLAVKQLQAEGGWITFTAYIWQHLNWTNTGMATFITIPSIIIGILIMLWWIPALIFWPIIHFIVYTLIRVPNYHWYYYPIDFVLGLAILIAVVYLVAYIFDHIISYILNSEWFNSIKQTSAIILSMVIIIGVQPILRSTIISIIQGNVSKHLSSPRYTAYTQLAALMPNIAGRSDFTLLTHEVGIFGFLHPQAYIRDVVGLATPIHNKNELWNWDNRVAQFDPNLILWPFKNPPHYQIFGVKTKMPIKVFERAIIANNGTPYTLYLRTNAANKTIQKQIVALQAMVAGATRLSAPLKGIGLDNDHIGLFAHAPSNIFLDVPLDASAITLGFGYKDGAWQGKNNPDGANFIVRSSNKTPLFNRWLDPKHTITDRGTQFVTINLSSEMERIELVIEPGSNVKWDWTYWAAHNWQNQTTLNADNGIPNFSGNMIGNKEVSIAKTCIGSIDFINGNKATKQFSASNTLEVRGWLAQSPTQNVSTSAILVLSDDKGRNMLFKTQKINRPDVATHFNNPTLNSVGFRATINTSSMTGNYNLGLGFIEDENVKLCRQFKIQAAIN